MLTRRSLRGGGAALWELSAALAFPAGVVQGDVLPASLFA